MRSANDNGIKNNNNGSKGTALSEIPPAHDWSALTPLDNAKMFAAGSPSLNQLLQLLELLPWPLQLHSAAGEVLGCNTSWQQTFVEDEVQSMGLGKLLEAGSPVLAPAQLLRQWGQHWQLHRLSLSPSFPHPSTTAAGAVSLGVDKPEPGLGASLDQALTVALKASQVPDGCWLILAEEITLRHQEQQHQAILLQRLHQLRNQFWSGVGHELKTPMTALLGLSQVLLKGGVGELNERQSYYLQLIHHNSRQIATLVNDLLELAQLEAGPLELCPQALALLPLCQRAYEQAQYNWQQYSWQQFGELPSGGRQSEPSPQPAPPATAAGVLLPAYSLEIEPGLETLTSDRQRLQQILVHLLTNALKFTAATGQIGLRVAQTAGWLTFRVWDTGSGIAPEQQPSIFQQFQTARLPASPLLAHPPHSGLGLILCRRLAQGLGGELAFTSTLGQGSEFTLFLPLSIVTAEGPAKNKSGTETIQPQAGSSGISSPGIVLVATLAFDQQQELITLLESHQYTVVLARSGPELVDKACILQPQMILLSPELPLLGLTEVLKLLNSMPETTHLPVVLITAARTFSQGLPLTGLVAAQLQLPLQAAALEELLLTLTPPKACPLPTVPNPSPPAPATVSPVLTEPLRDLTVLRLGSSYNLQLNYCRVLEADDLEQAELLCRIWQPQVLIWDWQSPEPQAASKATLQTTLQELEHYPHLLCLPLITLDELTTRLAREIPGLNIFPCLIADMLSSSPTEAANTLQQALQIASSHP